jgi:flagellar basal body-associated protein FliL
MKNNTIVIVIVVIVILVIGGWFLMMGQKNNGQPANSVTGTNPQNQTAPAANNQNTQNNASTFSGTLSDLMAKKTPVNCQVSFDQNGTTQTQSMYFDGSNVRSDIVLNVGGQQNTAHVVIKDGWEYMWYENALPGMAAGQGTKINLSSLPKNPQGQKAPAAAQDKGGIDTQKNMNFSCKPWTPDASQFVLPANVQFQDLSSLMQPPAIPAPAVTGAAGAPSVPANVCAVCKNIPAGTARTQCETSCASATK